MKKWNELNTLRNTDLGFETLANFFNVNVNCIKQREKELNVQKKKLFKAFDERSPISSDEDLNIPNFVQKRETAITDLVEAISAHNKNRLKLKFIFQIIIVTILLVLLGAFAITTISLVFNIANGKIQNISVIVVLLSSTIISFITSIFTALHVIVKYIFPSKEEEYSMEILKIISKSDLKYLNLHSKRTKNEEIPVRDDNEKN